MEKIKVIATNKRAYHDYFILEKVEAGIVLVGTEVKSLREARANLKESYAQVKEGEVVLFNCHISPYRHGNINNHEPTRERKLLLHRLLARPSSGASPWSLCASTSKER